MDNDPTKEARIQMLRERFGDKISRYTDEQLWQTWSEWYISSDNLDDATLLRWLQEDHG